MTKVTKATDYSPLAKKRPFIVLWGNVMGSFEPFINNELLNAEIEDAPLDALYSDTNGGWSRAGGITNRQIRTHIEENYPELFALIKDEWQRNDRYIP